jgi:hypothetical protein
MITGAIPVEFGQAFPHGAYVVGKVEPVNDFDKSTKDNPVQQVDKDTGKLLWQVPVMDADPDLRRGQHEVTVKIVGDHQPVPPEQAGETPFRPVEFDGLTVTPWLDDRGNRPRIAYSFKATDMRAPAKGAAKSTTASGKAA